jgi:hypothetical protein
MSTFAKIGGWFQYGVWVNDSQDWLRDSAGFIRRYESSGSAVEMLNTWGLLNTTRADIPRSGYVATVSPQAR